MKRAKGIMYAQRWIESSLAFALATCLLAACASQPTAVERPAGYWSQVEDFGANPPPESVVNAASEGTYHPFVQAPGDAWGDGYTVGGMAGYYDDAWMRPGFDAYYYADPFYATSPYPRSVYAPTFDVTPLPRAKPDPVPSSKPPAPHPVKPPRPAPPHASNLPARPSAPPPPPVRSGGTQPVKN